MDQNVSVIVAYLFACTETECAGPQPSFSTDALDWEPRDKQKITTELGMLQAMKIASLF